MRVCCLPQYWFPSTLNPVTNPIFIIISGVPDTFSTTNIGIDRDTTIVSTSYCGISVKDVYDDILTYTDIIGESMSINSVWKMSNRGKYLVIFDNNLRKPNEKISDIVSTMNLIFVRNRPITAKQVSGSDLVGCFSFENVRDPQTYNRVFDSVHVIKNDTFTNVIILLFSLMIAYSLVLCSGQ